MKHIKEGLTLPDSQISHLIQNPNDLDMTTVRRADKEEIINISLRIKKDNGQISPDKSRLTV